MDISPAQVRALQSLTLRLEGGSELSGTELADTLGRIAACELAEGGPYAYADGIADLGWNLVIRRFLRASDVSLPNLDAYLAETVARPAPWSAVLDSRELMEEIARFNASSIDQAESRARAGEAYSAEETRCMAEMRAAMAARTADPVAPELRDGVAYVIERTIRGNPDRQMSLMPLYMRQALGEAGSVFDDRALGELGFANASFWSSFIVYDDFWDEDEAAAPRLLPVANFLARSYIRFFDEYLPQESGFADFFHHGMDALDAANGWETLQCRMRVDAGRVTLPDTLPAYGEYDVKFHPAAGHVMGPVAMLMRLGYAADSDEVSDLVDYFRHYLIAMQLNDDAHDWREDLERGHISTAVAVLLAEWKERNPERSNIDLVDDLPELERLFWFEVLEPFCEKILDRCVRSWEALARLTFLDDPKPLERYITQNEEAAKLAFDAHRQSREFLHAVGT